MKTPSGLSVLSLLAGTILFAFGPAILKLMTTMAGRFGVSDPGAVSFCNVLFVGNFCAGLMTLVVFGARRIVGEYSGLARRTKHVLLASAMISTIYPALIFTALEHTTVVNIVILSRLNGIVFVALAYVLFRATIRPSEAVGYAIIAVGVVILVLAETGDAGLGRGEVLVLISTVFFALTEVVSKKVLAECSIELYVFFRNLVSAIIFFVTAVYLYGFEHFADAFSGELWILMLAYAGVAVVAAQFLWLRATRVLPVRVVANSQLLNPVFSILFAFLLLGEAPSFRQWYVMGIVFVGMMVPFVAAHLHGSAARNLHYSAGMVGTH